MRRTLLTFFMACIALVSWAEVLTGSCGDNAASLSNIIEVRSSEELLATMDSFPSDGTEITVRLQEDVAVDWWYVYYNRNVVLDLNGKTLTLNGCIEIIKGASLRVTGNGTIIQTAQYNTFYNHGSLTIDNGTFRFQNESCAHIWSNNDNEEPTKVVINGGDFRMGNPNSVLMGLEGGTDCTINGGYFEHTYVATDNTTNTNSTLWSNQNTTLTINGGTFICSGQSSTVAIFGAATINDATIINDNTYKGWALGVKNGNVTINGGTIESVCQEGTCVFVENNGVLRVNGGTIEDKGRWSALWCDNTSSMYINGGTIINNGYAETNTSSTIRTNGNVEIRDAQVINKGKYTNVYAEQNGRILLFGGTFTAASMYCFSGFNSNIYIFGGKFSHSSTDYTERVCGIRFYSSDPVEAAAYPLQVKPLSASIKDVVWIRNVQTGKYLGVTDGSNWGTEIRPSDVGNAIAMSKVADQYVLFCPFIGNQTVYGDFYDASFPYYGFLGVDSSNPTHPYLYADRYARESLFAATELRPGVYSLKLRNFGYLTEKDGTIVNNGATDQTEAAQWEILTYDDLVASLSDASAKNGKDFSQAISGPDFTSRDRRLLCAIPLSTKAEHLKDGVPLRGGDICLWNHTDWSSYSWGTGFSTNNIYTHKSGTYEWPYLEYKATTFSIEQTLTHLPNGVYRVSCYGFYRNASSPITTVGKRNNGTEELLAILFAGDESTPIMSILDDASATTYTGASRTSLGYVPTSSQGVVNAMNMGYYENFVYVEVKDHTLTFGCRKDSKASGDWTILDQFRLTYYGDEPGTLDAIQRINPSGETAPVPVVYYTLSGMPLTKAAKGINIVRYSDGSSRTVMVR